MCVCVCVCAYVSVCGKPEREEDQCERIDECEWQASRIFTDAVDEKGLGMSDVSIMFIYTQQCQ